MSDPVDHPAMSGGGEGEGTPLIRLTDVWFAYPGGAPVLKGVNLSLGRGERIGLLGPNGGGKTTLFHVIMGLVTPTSGTVEILGQPRRRPQDFRDVYRHVGLLFQDADDQLFSPTVLEDVAFGPLNLGMSREQALAASRKALADLGLEGFEDRVTHRLSGGEKRMVALATLLSMSPRVLLLDEPSAGLDESTRERLIEVLRRLPLAYLLISHESEFMAAVTDRMFSMENGVIRKDVDVRRYVHVHPAADHEHFGDS